MENGLIHLYTGNGKGKTTAAVGLAVRAAGCGKEVLFVQFMKGRDSGELHGLERIGNIRVLRSGEDFGFFRSMSEEQKRRLTEIHNGLLREALARIRAGKVDLLVLDEVTYPVKWGLLDEALLRRILAGEADRAEADGGTADRAEADRAAADGGTTDRAVADGGTADRAAADGGTADRAAADHGTTDRAAADGGTADRAAADRGAAGEAGPCVPVRPEIVCTGRDAPAFLLESADYLTEMKEIRHPYQRGIPARQGVEY